MDQKNNKEEQGINEQGAVPKYVVGDLLWAKIGKYPFWPCMVSYDPFTGCYFKKKKVRSDETIIYHVQYFGKQVQRGWTLPSLIMPYEGVQEFYSKKKKIIEAEKSANVQRKISAKYSVAPIMHEAWNFAVREAEDAMEFEIQERYESFVFKYELDITKSATKSGTGKKGKSKRERNMRKKAKEIYGSDKRICKICDQGKADLKCSGTCLQYFHKDCLGLLSAPEDFKCVHCVQGLDTCFICKKSGPETFHCSKCEYRYHEDCVRRFACVDIQKKICPYHVCLTCHNTNRKSKSKGTFVNCIMCPTSFHGTLTCIPVGSVKLSSTTMICPDHFSGKKKVSPQCMINVSYCSVCSEGGKLICCESCPNSYHTSCINTNEVPVGDFFCEDCTSRQYLYVGMIVWAKTGNFRWWPAQIFNFDDLPLNIKNMNFYDGEFPVQYFGTDEYFWTHRGRVIPYADHHKDIAHTGSKQCRMDWHYKLGLEEAAEAYNVREIKQQISKINEQRDNYKHIKVNRAVAPAQIASFSGKSVLPCCCNPNKPYPCGESSGCLNRSMLMECHPDVCLAGERCENQKFQRRTYPQVKVFRTSFRGWGLQSKQFIPKGTFVIEYVGEVITHEDVWRRVVEMQEKNKQNYYFLYLDSRRMIDAGPQGNLSRFINHACSANCEMSKWSVNGDSRIGIFALRDIYVGEELTFNYQSDTIQFEQHCFCGTDDCQGFIGRNGEKRRKKIKSKK